MLTAPVKRPCDVPPSSLSQVVPVSYLDSYRDV